MQDGTLKRPYADDLRPALLPVNVQAVRAWKLMGRRIDWVGLPAVAAYLRIGDLDGLLRRVAWLMEWVG